MPKAAPEKKSGPGFGGGLGGQALIVEMTHWPVTVKNSCANGVGRGAACVGVVVRRETRS